MFIFFTIEFFAQKPHWRERHMKLVRIRLDRVHWFEYGWIWIHVMGLEIFARYV